MKYIHIRVKTQQTFVFKTNVLICFFSQRRPHGDISHLNKLPFQLYKTSQHITKEYQYNHHFLDEKKKSRVFFQNRTGSTLSWPCAQLCSYAETKQICKKGKNVLVIQLTPALTFFKGPSEICCKSEMLLQPSYIIKEKAPRGQMKMLLEKGFCTIQEISIAAKYE